MSTSAKLVADTVVPISYTIRSVNDFLSVPPDKLRTCLLEFGNAIEHVRRVVEIAQEMATEEGIEIPAEAILMNEFDWIDDGIISIGPVKLIDGSTGEECEIE